LPAAERPCFVVVEKNFDRNQHPHCHETHLDGKTDRALAMPMKPKTLRSGQ
jgi:hypothetical protein